MKNIKDCYQKEIKDMVNRQFYFKEKSLLVLEMPQVLEKEQRFPFADYSELLLHSRFADAIAMLKKICVLFERATGRGVPLEIFDQEFIIQLSDGNRAV